MVNIEINGIRIQAREGSMVIEAADEAGIVIPRFCYHRKLSIAANCRMCLVEVEKAPKPLPACATPVTEGMRVFTRSAKALEAQRATMEFLLINHPLDCPICDQGGECDLQDIAMGFGESESRYREPKRVVPDKNLGPLIATDMTRCIHCTRCVRFGREIAGVPELGATGRGEHTTIGTYVEKVVSSELSGNVIDLCPVGALTSKPYRYTGRPWENRSHPGVSPHDCLGSNLDVQTRRGRVMRVLPRDNEAINECWLSDRDRFSYTALAHGERLHRPLIRQGDAWREVEWQTALEYAAEGLRRVRAAAGADGLGALISPSATVEEGYLAQRLLRGLGSGNVDFRLRRQDFAQEEADPRAPWLGCAIADLEDMDAVLLVGSHVRKDQPLAGLRLRRAALRGARVMFLNPAEFDFNFPVAEHLVAAPAAMVDELAAVAKALLEIEGTHPPEGLAARLENVEVHDRHLAVARHLHAAQQAHVIVGTQAFGQAEFSALRALANLVAHLAGAGFGYLPEGANAVGLSLAGALPRAAEPAGRHAGDMTGRGLRGVLLLGVEPEYDFADPAAARRMLDEADFVVALTAFVTDEMKRWADVLLPVAAFAENEGTFVNVQNDWQGFAAAAEAPGEARPAWKVLRVLGNFLNLEGFDYMQVDEVREAARAFAGEVEVKAATAWAMPRWPAPGEALQRIGYLPLYHVDSLVRRAAPLQGTPDARADIAWLGEAAAAALGVADGARVAVRQGGAEVVMEARVDAAVPDRCVLVAAATPQAARLGPAWGPVEVSAVKEAVAS